MAVTTDDLHTLQTLAPNAEVFVDSATKQPMELYFPPHKSDIPAKCAQLAHRFGAVVQKKWTPKALVLIDPDAKPDLGSVPRNTTFYSISFVKDRIVSGPKVKIAKYVCETNPTISPRLNAPAAAAAAAAAESAGKAELLARIEAHLKQQWRTEGEAFRTLADELGGKQDAAALRQLWRAHHPPAAAELSERRAPNGGTKRALRVEEAEGEGEAERPSQRAARAHSAAHDDEAAAAAAAVGASEEEVQLAGDWIKRLAREARVHPNVVTYALYVYSGRLRPAREFLLHRPPAEARWSAADDERLLSPDGEAVHQLIQARGDKAVHARLRWLEGR